MLPISQTRIAKRLIQIPNLELQRMPSIHRIHTASGCNGFVGLILHEIDDYTEHDHIVPKAEDDEPRKKKTGIPG